MIINWYRLTCPYCGYDHLFPLEDTHWANVNVARIAEVIHFENKYRKGECNSQIDFIVQITQKHVLVKET